MSNSTHVLRSPRVKIDSDSIYASTSAATGVMGSSNGDTHESIHPPKASNGVRMESLLSPVSAQPNLTSHQKAMRLELEDGTIFQGYSFGAEKSIAGELVFQTGMVGYPESLTDPSYRGQILVLTFPLVGNYGVPSREAMDDLLPSLPAQFEAAEIHITGLVVASYSGEDFSHHLATSSLGAWLKEQGVPAMSGVDTRALTKRIREEGSMLGKMLLALTNKDGNLRNGLSKSGTSPDTIPAQSWRGEYEEVEWFDPNKRNLAAAGKNI